MAPGQRGLSLLAWIIAFTVLCTFTLGLRLWSAIVAKRKFFADDAMVLFAFVRLKFVRSREPCWLIIA